MNKERAQDLCEALELLSNPNNAQILGRFFKTGKGEYGEGDQFWGVKVPELRKVAKAFIHLPLEEIQLLIEHPVHEVRACGFMILVYQYEKLKKEQDRQVYVDYYLKNARKANNWDLVDNSAPKILGRWLRDKERTVLYQLAESDSLWEQRIAIVATWTIIREDQYEDTFALAVQLIDHPHDLIRKAVGWMLREIGKRDREALTHFLEEYASRLSRTSLRYSIEHYSPDERKRYMDMK